MMNVFCSFFFSSGEREGGWAWCQEVLAAREAVVWTAFSCSASAATAPRNAVIGVLSATVEGVFPGRACRVVVESSVSLLALRGADGRLR